MEHLSTKRIGFMERIEELKENNRRGSGCSPLMYYKYNTQQGKQGLFRMILDGMIEKRNCIWPNFCILRPRNKHDGMALFSL